MLKSTHELFGDIYKLLVQNTVDYLRGYSFSDDDAKILAVFLIHSYGNHEDFKDFLFVHNDRYGLPAYLCNRLHDELKQWKMDFLKDKLEVDKARLSYDTSFTRALNETSATHIQVLSLQLLSIESKLIVILWHSSIKFAFIGCERSVTSTEKINCDIKCLDVTFDSSRLNLPYPDGYESLQG